MSSFTDPLMVEILQGEKSGRGTALVVAPFRYDIGFKGSGDTVTVPPTFETDFASVPWWGRWLVSNFDRCAKAAVVHDYLLSAPRTRSRREIDRIFREALGVLKAPAWRRWLLWAAVRVQAVLRGDR